jgi:hypothetical protein
MNNKLSKLIENLTTKTRSGTTTPQIRTIFETHRIPLSDVLKLYERDPTCKASVDLLAASAVGSGFYTTIDEKYDHASEAKTVIDNFNEQVNLDSLLNDMARSLIACGNDFWLKLHPENLKELHRLPVDAIERIHQTFIQEENLKIPYQTQSYKLHQTFGGQNLTSEAMIHWRINCLDFSGYGTGVLQVLLHSLTFQNDRRPAFASIKAKIERIMPKIFEKYAGPDVLALLERADDETIGKFQQAIKNRGEEGAWLFYNGNGDIKPVTIDPRARFEYYVDHLINQFYLGCETPLPRLFSTPGFTEASANAALELQDILIKPIQRYIKRQVEREIFEVVLSQAGLNPAKAQARLNWSPIKMQQTNLADLLKAAEQNLIRPEEFRKNAIKFGWQLWEPETQEESLQ